MHLEPARPDDIPTLHALIESAYRGESARQGWSHEADLLDGQRTDTEALTDTIADPAQRLLVLRDGDRIDGCIALTDKGEGLVYVGMVTVAPDLQAGGIGRMLLAAAEDRAREDFDATRAEMTVIEQRAELIAWYERRGYRLTGERRPFPATDPRFGLPKRDDLAFVVLEKPL
ncbi:GNAT family N-acetyltransferase [Sphingomonas sp. LY29]|uniref:GNAT family N-acetyltransferase n=1 Tax=Sphingomonas sp. LY29 TaxID=3095341 RepID=UPI002D76EE28|nr:GNAT family N-acetyltransferase [Sphingomonas sp. LY29]WRP24998.1 GNAT family N-acetyltransferase [Sphingomonas sp. LY29]